MGIGFMNMQFIPIKTRTMMPPKDDIFSVLDESLMEIRERDIVMITCKVLSIHQGRCVKKDGQVSRVGLGKQESDWYINYGNDRDHGHIPTIKKYAFLGSAGVDASNGNGYFILPPENVSDLCQKVWAYLRKKFNLKELGVMAVDSHTLPFRYGVTGVTLGLFGLDPIRRYRYARDIFGGKFKETVNIADALAATTTLLFGEGDEKTPILIARGIEGVEFVQRESFSSLCVPEEKDIFWPIFQVFRKGGRREER